MAGVIVSDIMFWKKSIIRWGQIKASSKSAMGILARVA
jgi:hypothetical protein